jgi:hypothetical protein
MLSVDSRDSFTHCPVLFSRSTDFSSPLQAIANFGVRVYVSIVAGGSLTTQTIPANSKAKPSSAARLSARRTSALKDGVSTHNFR